jgi:hypothetical protein
MKNKKKSRDNLEIIIILALILALTVNFISLRKNIFFNPAEDTIFSFMSDVQSNYLHYKIAAPNNPAIEEELIINSLAQKYGLEKINESSLNNNSNKIIIGLVSDFENTPYKSLLSKNDGIIIFNDTTNSLFAYSSDISGLESIADILKNYTSYSDMLGFEAIELFNSSIEELFIEPVAIAKRTISALEKDIESSVRIDLEVLRPIDSLLIAEVASDGFDIKNKSVDYLLHSKNIIAWYLVNLNIGNYSLDYSLLPSVESGEIRGKVGIKIGSAEDEYFIKGQSNLMASSYQKQYTPPNGGGGGADPATAYRTKKFISFSDLSRDNLEELTKKDELIFELNIGENKTLIVEDIQNKYAVFKIRDNSLLLNVNLAIGQATKLNLGNEKMYNLYLKLEKIENNKVYFIIKGINEYISDSGFDISGLNLENPADFNLDLFNFDKNIISKIILFSVIALILIILSIIYAKKSKLEKGNTSKDYNTKLIIQKARIIAEEYRKRGYSEEQIKSAFRQNGWKIQDIELVLKS